MTDNNPEDCTLYNARLKLGFPERGDYYDWYIWVKALTDEEANRIYERHMICYKCRKALIDELNKNTNTTGNTKGNI